jgi:hypothetical protein
MIPDWTFPPFVRAPGPSPWSMAEKIAAALNPSAFLGEYPSKTVNIGVTEQAIFNQGSSPHES